MNALIRDPFTPRWRIDNIGRLLNNAIKRFESRILLEMEQAGYGSFSLSHITITRNLDTEGTRATELARRAGITKQSMGELIAQLEQSGIIERQPDPNDRRAKIIFFTPTGMKWLDAFGTALHRAEQEMCAELGEEVFEALRNALLRYDRNQKP
ncbi:MAG TPA: MarR family transcriptional regulator [Pusillimonas sp.]|jgi:DNA-binding MarR family transcriptional regulator|nr:MarR family transcriptional regulator [Pusillimonas sp.]HBT34001.1 MarR family transcriptional regulator [Pusillimonas sp.]HCN73050.1 MarR family transcriptional regulator [Pusillimonas sp.]HCP77045.1 MarR family transcriptional regulator [Pusillimonas sp.]|tara:strand:+ start:345 stop:806 length:462 start_codon:yes stop_codon:yes gene_type:complete